MLSTLIMTIIGADRPGLVQLVADRVAAHGGNWLESRMCRLGGEFAGIVRVELPSGSAADLTASLSALEGQGLRVVVHAEGAVARAPQAGRLEYLEIVGNDRPGIVRQITGVLAAHAVNVEEFSSECVDAPMGGTQLFQARATVLVPAGVSTQLIRSELEKLASDLMVDLRLSHD
jgi:glycine cleavage system regulatory protein